MTPDNKIIKNAVDTARQLVSEHDQLMPIFFVGSSNDLKIIGADFESEEHKDMAAEGIRKLASLMNAEYILFISEAYALTDQESAKEFYSGDSAYESLAEHPKAIEVLMCQLETKEEHFAACAEIKEGRVLGEIKWQRQDVVHGRFAGLLKQKQTKH